MTSVFDTMIFDSVLKPDQIASAKADLEYYGTDTGHHFAANPSLIIFPKTTAEVQACIKIAFEKKIKIVPSGGRTGYSGGASATNQEVVLSLERLNKIIELSVADGTIKVQAGASLEKVQLAASEAGLYYPIDFTTRGSAQIGGTIANNAGGIRVIRYGMTREWVLGLQVITASGELLEINRNLYKNNSGYNLVQLLCGSEGTLGVITEATLKLTTPPEDSALVCFALENVDFILPILEKIRAAGFVISLFEYMDAFSMGVVIANHKIPKPFQGNPAGALLLEIDQPPEEDFNNFVMELLEKEYISDAIKAESIQQHQHLMQLRDLIGDVINKNYTVHKQDISVPVLKIPEFLKATQDFFKNSKHNFEVALFGHAGDGNIHINVLNRPGKPKAEFFQECEIIDESIFKLVSSFNGSVSAEHGIGLLKKDHLHYCRSPEELRLMGAIKKAFDPDGILNPGKII